MRVVGSGWGQGGVWEKGWCREGGVVSGGGGVVSGRRGGVGEEG